MNKKLVVPVILMVLLSMVLSACGSAATPVAEPTAVVEPTSAPVAEPTAEPAAVIDVAALWAEFVGGIPADAGYGGVAATKLNEELVENAPFLLDIRQPEELEANGFIEGAVNIPVEQLLQNLDKLPAQDANIVIYCGSGHRGGFALPGLKLLGYTNVRNLAGGINAWKKAELPLVTSSMPVEPVAGTAPEVTDQALFDLLNGYYSNLPENYYNTNAEALNTDLADGKEYFLLDIRRADEVEKNGYIEGAVNIPFEELFTSLDQLPSTDTPMIVYCGSGHRSPMALMGLRLLGYEYAINLAGGFGGWKTAGYAVAGAVDWNVVLGEYLTALPEGYSAISAADFNVALADNAPFLLDIRQPEELEANGYIAGAVNIPSREVLANLDKLPAKDQPIVIYCASGHRGGLVMASLQLLGYTDVSNLAGGINGWVKAEFPVVTGSMPEAPVAGAAPEVDPLRFEVLNAFLSSLPEGYYATKAADLNLALSEAEKPFVLDVRETAELGTDGLIEGAVNIPMREVLSRLAELPEDKTAPIVVYCKSGHRASLVTMALRMIGYTGVTNLAGGFNGWKAAELPVVQVTN